MAVAGVRAAAAAGLAVATVTCLGTCRAPLARAPLWPPEACLRLTKGSSNEFVDENPAYAAATGCGRP